MWSQRDAETWQVRGTHTQVRDLCRKIFSTVKKKERGEQWAGSKTRQTAKKWRDWVMEIGQTAELGKGTAELNCSK